MTPGIRAAGVRAYQEANAAAYKTVFLSTIAFCGVGVIATFFTPNVDALLTRDVVVQLKGKDKDGDNKEDVVEKV